MSAPHKGGGAVIDNLGGVEAFAHATIAEGAEACRSLLVEASDSLHGFKDGAAHWARLRDVTGRFNLWASNIGAFAALHASLDYRLRDLADAKELILEHLENMSDGLTQLITFVDSYDESSQPVNGAGHTVNAIISSLSTSIDWLHRLANMIRRASISRQNVRASNFPLKDSQGDDATPVLTQLFRYWILRDFPTIAEELCARLISTMLLRRRRILYRRSRQVKLAVPTAKPAPKPAHLTLPAPADLGGLPVGEPATTSRIASTQYTATTVDPDAFRRVVSTPSRVSEAHTIAITSSDKDAIPLPPYIEPGLREFVCPFCCLILPAKDAWNRDTWDAHVKKDLDPYVCVFFPCTLGEEIFGTSTNWISHEQMHSMRWYCEVKKHRLDAFESQEEFIGHMRVQHPGKFKDAQLALLAEHSRRPLKRIFNACPLCGEDSVDNGRGLEDHVAHHLQHLALLSLPLLDTADDGDNVSSASSIESRGEDKLAVSRTTMKSETHRMPPFDFSSSIYGKVNTIDQAIPDIEEPERSDIAERWRIIRMRKLRLPDPYEPITEAEQRKDKVLVGFIFRNEGVPEPEQTKRHGIRLLHCSGDDIKLVDYSASEVPNYAILSHTWGDDEVTFRDFLDGTERIRLGFEKIRFCARTAHQDGLQHVWVDTCCIDKSNSAELTEAINSMFHWYQAAVRCYVYLSDMQSPPDDLVSRNDISEAQFFEHLRRSRWFTRGWTLQELLAPRSVDFFSKDGLWIGNKTTLLQQIHEITGIHISALRGIPLDQFSIEERFRWAEKRRTSREEDEAYCLIGIFGVNLLLMYGEGGPNALRRLREEVKKHSAGSWRPGIIQAADEQQVDDYKYFYNADKTPTKTFDALLRAIGQNIIDRFHVDKTKLLTRHKLAAFYKAVDDNYNKSFFDAPNESVSYIWQVLGCRHTFQPSDVDADSIDNFNAPCIPTLTLSGFVRWQSIHILLDPKSHVPYIINAVRNWELHHPETGERFPANISTSSFPTGPDPALVAWHGDLFSRLSEEDMSTPQGGVTTHHQPSGHMVGIWKDIKVTKVLLGRKSRRPRSIASL